MNTALICVDLQNDFFPGGALAVKSADQIINPIQDFYREHGSSLAAVVATQDWHPRDHQSFASMHPGCKIGDVIDLHGLPQVLWPDHCVQDSRGAEFHSAFSNFKFDFVARKGMQAEVDSYSGFFDNGHRFETALHKWLQDKKISNLIICGLATDYCVKYTVLDALKLGYKVQILQDGCRGVNLKPDDSDRALKDLISKGASI
jgi:nicotinamidase/pyrazinamidase